MDMNQSSVFDVQKLADEQISKSPGYITSLQKPLRRVYFSYKKNLAINPPLPHHKIIAGPQGIAFSSGSPISASLPPNVLQQPDKYFPKDSIVSAVALQFSFHGKNKKFKGAFVTVDKDERIKQAKEYSDLFSSIDDKDLFLTTVEHSAMFICITKSQTTKNLDAQIFICLNENQAMDILKALKGQPISGQIQPSEPPTSATTCDTNQAISSETQQILPQQPHPAGLQQPYPMNVPYYPTPQHASTAELMYNGGYEQTFYNMCMNAPLPGQLPYMPNLRSQFAANAVQNPAQPPYVQNAVMQQQFYPNIQHNFYSSYPNKFQQPLTQPLAPNPSNNDGGLSSIPRTHVDNTPPPDLASTCSDLASMNIQMKFPRPTPVSHPSTLPEMKNTQSGAQSTYPNLQTGSQGAQPAPQAGNQISYPNLQTSDQSSYPNLRTSNLSQYPNFQTSNQSQYPNFQTSNQSQYPNFQTSDWGSYPNFQTSDRKSYLNFQTVPDPRFSPPHPDQQVQQPFFPNHQLQPQDGNPSQKGFQQPFFERPVMPPPGMPITSSADDSNLKTLTFQKATGGMEQAAPSNIASQAFPMAKPEQVMPAVPPKPGKPNINNANNNPKSELKHPKKIIGIKVMPAMPNAIGNPLDDPSTKPLVADKLLQNQQASG